MVRGLALAVIVGMAMGAAQAQTAPPDPKADCSMFKRMSDGRWTSTIKSRVGNPKSFITLEPGIPIARDTTIFGMNVSDTIDKLCGK